MENNLKIKLVSVLHEIGSEKCLTKAIEIVKKSTTINSLNLRSLDLNSLNVKAIAYVLNKNKDSNTIKSISFSYNKSLGDIGAIALSKNLPNNIQEIGLVNCGINDEGGIELLNWIKKSPHLKMVCIEQNNFSIELQSKFQKFSEAKPNILFIKTNSYF